MKKPMLEYLGKLLNAPSPSGYEDAARAVWRAEMKSVADRVYGDTHGNSVAVLNEQGSPRVMLAGHIDEIGFQASYINDEGYIAFQGIGGFDEMIIPGRRVTIHTADGPVKGVIGKKPIHLMKQEDRKKPTELGDLWIDIGLNDSKKVKKLVAIGDPITYSEGFELLNEHVFIGRGLDDRIGAFVVGEVLRQLRGKEFNAAVFAVATVQEEVGLRGAKTSAFGVNPDVGFAVDVTFALSPDADKKKIGEIKLGGGPVVARGANFNPRLFELVLRTAKKRKIDVQLDAAPGGTGTDANALQLNRAGVPSTLISVPNRYMHTPVEMCDLRDVEQCAALIAETILALTPDTDFVL
jgi:endoglucanase